MNPATATAAALGTAKRAPGWPEDLPIARRPGSDDTTALLDALALLAVLERAGERPGSGDERSPAPPDDRPQASGRAAALLDLHLAQPHEVMGRIVDPVEHWLQRATDRRVVVPHRLLPAVLDRATKTAGLRSSAAAAAGPRGAWLADRNPGWSWLRRAAEPERDWAHLTPALRGGALRRIRREDPARGTALVAETWSTESAAMRRDFLVILRTGLGAADEPLLEAALDDRSESVRAAAVQTLDGLPGSRRATRMAARLRPLIGRTGLLRARLTVELPDDPDDAGVRDGLSDPPSKRSRRGWHLERIAAGAPLDTWTSATGLSRAVIVRDLPDDARRGVRQAVRAARDAAWAAVLLEHDPALTDLLPLLPAPDAERTALAALRRGALEGARGLATLDQWSPALSRDIAARIRRDPALLDALQFGLQSMDPGITLELAEWASTAPASTGLKILRRLIQHHAAIRTIDEAFA